MEVKGLDEWRNYFRTSLKGDIFDIIENGIKVAALDCPKGLKLRRDGIAELLFSCKWKSCLGCKTTEPVVRSKVSGENETCMEQKDRGLNYVDVEALTVEIEEESQTLGEVLRIKEIVINSQDESDSTLYESLRKLELMPLNVDILKATEIGKSVDGLRKHRSKDIRQLAETLIDLWKNMVDEWYSATAIKDHTPDSVNPSVLDEDDGLPSPPLDAGAFFAAPQSDMDFSQFFDGIDDDGNPRDSGELLKDCKTGRKPPMVNQIKKQGNQPANVVKLLSKENKGIVKVSKLSTESGPGRPLRVNPEQKVTNTIKQQQSSPKLTIQRRPVNAQQDVLKTSDFISEQAKLEATKRKLQESYQQAENAKKQRTVQVMELHDLPKQGLLSRKPNMKPGSHNRQRGNMLRQFHS